MQNCLKCANPTERPCRGLCPECYGVEKRAGTLANWPIQERPKGNPDEHDPIAIEIALKKLGDYHLKDPHDRAKIAQMVNDGEVTKKDALLILHCSGTTLRRLRERVGAS
ncbi:hypothetical protein TIN2_77 [Tsukamurella phage TIN2]|uniref:Uncharacterized protein n=1 Tax=Tsukamurella phage TIN2 TaxID=1636545 RepID=A0A0K0N5T1_9CAUD|nr:hypothetical protein AVT55_gp046 [Tsukamurella phage TIN2]AKJ71767.1 hypothetical protein TIN2_77 [Tsukamurella phage TIN2]